IRHAGVHRLDAAGCCQRTTALDQRIGALLADLPGDLAGVRIGLELQREVLRASGRNGSGADAVGTDHVVAGARVVVVARGAGLGAAWAEVAGIPGAGALRFFERLGPTTLRAL